MLAPGAPHPMPHSEFTSHLVTHFSLPPSLTLLMLLLAYSTQYILLSNLHMSGKQKILLILGSCKKHLLLVQSTQIFLELCRSSIFTVFKYYTIKANKLALMTVAASKISPDQSDCLLTCGARENYHTNTGTVIERHLSFQSNL